MSAALRALLSRPFLLAALSLAGCTAAALAGFGDGLDGLQAVTRYTGRMGLFLFAPAFAAMPLNRLLRASWTKDLVRSRRRLGLAFGFHHLVHLALLLSYLRASGHELNLARAGGGALGYFLLVLMMLTSSDAAVGRLGAASWRRLHRAGLWYLWGIFALTYGLRLAGKVADPGGGLAEYLPCMGLVLALGGLRIAAYRRGRAAGIPVTSAA